MIMITIIEAIDLHKAAVSYKMVGGGGAHIYFRKRLSRVHSPSSRTKRRLLLARGEVLDYENA